MSSTTKLSFWNAARQELLDFALPEKTVSLKLVFDNLRNYLMCAAVVGVVRTAYRAPTSDPDWPWALQWVIASVTALNIIQSWCIIQGVVDRLRTLPRVLERRWIRSLTKLVLVGVVFMTVMAVFQIIPAFVTAISLGLK